MGSVTSSWCDLKIGSFVEHPSLYIYAMSKYELRVFGVNPGVDGHMIGSERAGDSK